MEREGKILAPTTRRTGEVAACNSDLIRKTAKFCCARLKERLPDGRNFRKNISNQHSKSSRPLIEFAPLFLFFLTNYFAGIFGGRLC